MPHGDMPDEIPDEIPDEVPDGIPDEVPAGAYEMALAVRSYEAGPSGTVRPATLLRYLENLATRASADRGFDHTWYEREGSAWVVRDMRLRIDRLPGLAEEVRLATWLSDYRKVQAFREYAIWRDGDSSPLARAQGRWAYVDRITGQLRRIPDSLIERFGALGHTMPTQPMAPVTDSTSASELRLVAREYEADSQQHINNCVYADWLEEGLYALLAARGIEGGSHGPPSAYHIEYMRPVLPRQRVTLTTRVAAAEAGLVVDQSIVREEDGQLVLRAHSAHGVTGSL
jgi:acyl-CoA thioesterase FadM